MADDDLDKHQVSGLDDRERGFSRPVEFECRGEGCRAILQYETTRVTTDMHPTQEAALLALIQTLHTKGYRQLKSQVCFRRGVYLGSQELWIEYPDPHQAEPKSSGFLEKLLLWLRPRTAMNNR